MNLLQEIEKAGPQLVALGGDLMRDFEDKAIDDKTLADAESAGAAMFPGAGQVISLSVGALAVLISALHGKKAG